MNELDPSLTAVSEKSLAERMAALEQQRLDWESQRHQQMVDLKEQSRLLSEAWQRLENQQRAVMQSRGEIRSSETRAAPDAGRTRNAPQPVVDSTPVLPPASMVNSELCNQLGPSAVEQFRLLQRDVQAHHKSNIDSNRTSGESS